MAQQNKPAAWDEVLYAVGSSYAGKTEHKHLDIERFYSKLGFKKMNTAMAIFENESLMIENGTISQIGIGANYLGIHLQLIFSQFEIPLSPCS